MTDPTPDAFESASATSDVGSGGGDPDPQPITLEQLQSELEQERRAKGGIQRERDQLRQQMQQVHQYQQQQMWQQQQQQQAAPTWDESGLTPEETRELVEAQASLDVVKTNELMRKQASRLREASRMELAHNFTTATTELDKKQKFFNILQNPKFKDPAFAEAVLDSYNRIQNDPSYSYIDRSTMEVAPGQHISPTLFTLAMKDAESSVGSAVRQASEDSRLSQQPFTEPSRTTPKKTGFNPMKHMTEGERAAVDDMKRRGLNYSYDRWFENLPADQQSARISSGKPQPLPRRNSIVVS
jgi:hypothetical protein